MVEGPAWAKVLRLEQYMACLGNNVWTRFLKIEITKWQSTLQIQPEDTSKVCTRKLYTINVFLMGPTFKN